jgi:hypothetical protein
VPILLKCSCGKALKVKDESAGKHVKCPGCGNVLSVPHPEGGGAAPAPRAREEKKAPAPKVPPPRSAAAPAPGKQGAAVQVLLAVAGVLVLGCVALAAWWFFLRGAGGSYDWQEFSSAEGHFKVLLPSQPTASTKRLTTAAGPVTQYAFAVERPKFRERFVVGYVDYPPEMTKVGPHPILRGELELLIKQIK